MNFNKETLALYGAYNFDTQRSISVPIYQNTAYNFEKTAGLKYTFDCSNKENAAILSLIYLSKKRLFHI